MRNLRFVFVDTLLLIKGELHRKDFTPDKMIYPLSTAQCTRMLKDYLSLFPNQTRYAGPELGYLPSSTFSAPLLPGDTRQEKTAAGEKLTHIFKKINGNLKVLKAAYLESLILVKGGFRPPELSETFNLSKPQLTRDLMVYRKEHPNQTVYDHSARQYIRLDGFTGPVLSQLYGEKNLADKAVDVIQDTSFLRMLDERTEEMIINAL
ncbi:hypothetical protein [Alteromonas sp. 14N.309.X.WAT.G.H12]|uniref:hypothetical protein n=1 Tax=Alteromonas sp. 14N.309.X.WAT.G.H12 TaxID=3120824 RepID=UPI002FD05E35